MKCHAEPRCTWEWQREMRRGRKEWNCLVRGAQIGRRLAHLESLALLQIHQSEYQIRAPSIAALPVKIISISLPLVCRRQQHESGASGGEGCRF